MKRIFHFLIFVISLLIGSTVQAQAVEMADTMRSEGKIYVVVAIILVVLTGLLLYLFLLDKKVGKMEKLLQDKQQTKS